MAAREKAEKEVDNEGDEAMNVDGDKSSRNVSQLF